MIRAAARVALLAGATVALAAEDAADAGLRRLAGTVTPDGPVWRIALEGGHRVLLDSDRPYRVLDPATGSPVGKESYRGETAFVADGGPEDEPPSIYRVQVGAFTTAEAAEAERARLAAAFGVPAVSRYVPDRGSWRVRLGAAADRSALAPLLSRLREAGLQGIWIAEEPSGDAAGVRLRVVDASYESRLATSERVAVVPAEGARLRVQGKAYRGVVEVRLTQSGTLRAIDWVELEAYLRGVVPSELGPET